MSTLIQDLRYALRTFGRAPGFTAVTLLTITLGIGANTAMFSFANAILLRSLPVQEPDQLVAISSYDADLDANTSFSYPLYRDLRDRGTVVSGILARGGQSFSVSDGNTSQLVYGELISGNYYEVLGVQPAAGRLMTAEDDRAQSPAVAVLSYAFWQRQFGGDRAVVGRDFLINGYKATVVGITPKAFHGTNPGVEPELWLPLSTAPQMRTGTDLESRRHQWLTMLGRRKPAVSTAQAQAALDTLFRQILAVDVESLPKATSEKRRQRYVNQHVVLEPGHQGFARIRRNMEKPVLLLLASTGLVLLIACANIAGLLLVRGVFRQKELRMRAALGAGRGRLIRQLLTESLLLSLLGGIAGFLASYWLSAGLVRVLPVRQFQLDVTPDWTAFGYSMCAAIVTGVLFGLLPAINATRGINGALKADSATGNRAFTLRGALLVAQVALSVVMLFSAGLFLRTLYNLQTLDTGFKKQSVLVASISPYLNGYKPAAASALAGRILDRVRAMPGVEDAGWSAASLLTGAWDQNGIVVDGYQTKDGEPESSHFDRVSPGYFSTIQMPLVTGRAFTDGDNTAGPSVAVVNEAFAKHFFPGQSAIGTQFRYAGEPRAKNIEIVGVVRDARYVSLREKKTPYFAYVPIAQSDIFSLALHVRSTGDAEKLAGALREQVRQVDPRLPVHDVTTLAAQIDQSLLQEQMMAVLVTSFGAMATVLAALGLYGVLAFSVTRRTKEIGIRIALGAQASQVSTLILRHTALLIGAGLLLGAAGSLAISGVVRSLLFGVTPNDPLSLALAAVTLIAISMLAAYLPARRAARIDPLEALREE